jgi:hypothetical protein
MFCHCRLSSLFSFHTLKPCFQNTFSHLMKIFSFCSVSKMKKIVWIIIVIVLALSHVTLGVRTKCQERPFKAYLTHS